MKLARTATPEAGRARKGGKANARTAAKRLLTVLAFPLLPFHLALRFLSPFRGLCGEDQRHTARCRRSEFRNTVLQFAYFILWLPEYRSVFYMRCGVAGRLLRFTPPSSPDHVVHQDGEFPYRRGHGGSPRPFRRN